MLAVNDTGTGMDEETRARLFEPFFTTKGRERGTGLGLSIVFGIVRQTGGNVEVASEPGVGTSVQDLSAARGAAARCRKPKPPLARAERGSETILLVEDEEMVRKLVRETLEREGYKILEAAGPEQAAKICRDYEGPMHLMITDVVMPRESGRVLAAGWRRRPDMKVMYMSGYTDTRNRRRRRKAARRSSCRNRSPGGAGAQSPPRAETRPMATRAATPAGKQAQRSGADHRGPWSARLKTAIAAGPPGHQPAEPHAHQDLVQAAVQVAQQTLLQPDVRLCAGKQILHDGRKTRAAPRELHHARGHRAEQKLPMKMRLASREPNSRSAAKSRRSMRRYSCSFSVRLPIRTAAPWPPDPPTGSRSRGPRR